MSKLAKHNDGFKFIMVVIFILSKYAWLELLKSKLGIAIKNALEHIFSEAIRRPKVIQTDKGTEFFNVLVKNYLKDNNIKLFATHSEEKAQIVERLNRTIKGTMFRYFTIILNKNILISFKTLYRNTMRLTTEVPKWLLKMLTKIKKLKSG